MTELFCRLKKKYPTNLCQRFHITLQSKVFKKSMWFSDGF